VSPLVNRGIAYFALGSWDNAARDLREKFRVSESVSIWEAVLIFLARSRMGQKEGAGKELRVAREGLAADPEAAWARAVVDFLLGEGSVEQVEKAGDAKGRPLDAHLYVGFHHLLGGRRDEAEWRFERAVGGANEKPGFERIIARAELEKLRFERRAAVLDELEAKFRAQKPFRAEFRARDVSGEKDGRSITSFDVWYDRAASRLHVTLRGRDEQEGRDWEGHVATEGLSFLTWGILEKPYKMDATPFFRDLEKWDREIREEFDRLLPQGASRKDEAAPLEPVLVIQMEPKPARDQDGAFRFAVGKGGRPASWLREPRRPVGVAMEEKEGEVVFEISSPRKTIVVDRATGLLRSLRTLDYDGKAREILLSSFRTIEKFPEPDRPASFEPLPLDLSQFEGRWREQRGWLEALVGEGLDRWDDVTKAGRQREVQVLVIRWAARYADGLRTYALKTLARIHVRRRLDQGTPLADLAGDDEAARFAEACKGEAAEIERFIRGRLEDVVAEVETRAIESPIDSRRYGVLAELLKASFEYRTVEAERSKAYGDRTREALKEELDAQKRL
jgi:hypothetical protein